MNHLVIRLKLKIFLKIKINILNSDYLFNNKHYMNKYYLHIKL